MTKPTKPSNNPTTVNAAPPIPLFRRKRGYLLTFLTFLILILYLRSTHSSTSTSNSTHPFSFFQSKPQPQTQAQVQVQNKGLLKKPTAALQAMALQQGLLRPLDSNGNELFHDQVGGMAQAEDNDLGIKRVEKLLLLFQALKQGVDLDLHEEAFQSRDQKIIIKLVAKLAVEKKLYKQSPSQWLSKLRPSHPITVFSKSYCPYSSKAKRLLSELGIKYTVYEVDLRTDAEALSRTLKALNGRDQRTFPMIFLQDTAIGGYDDLLQLQQNGSLEKLLRNVGAV